MVPIRDAKENLEILCEGHVQNFHELFFSLEPDLNLIKRNIEEKALFMVDWSGNRLYARLVEKKYFHDVAMRDYNYFVELDSIQIDYATYPFPFTFYGKQAIEKGKSTTYRNLVTKGHLKKAGITPNNLNGIKIIDFEVVDNSNLERREHEIQWQHKAFEAMGRKAQKFCHGPTFYSGTDQFFCH